MPGFNPFKKRYIHNCPCYNGNEYACLEHGPLSVYDQEEDEHPFDPERDGFGYPMPDEDEVDKSDFAPLYIQKHDGCTCTVRPASSYLIETDTERAFRAADVSICPKCYDRLLEEI